MCLSVQWLWPGQNIGPPRQRLGATFLFLCGVYFCNFPNYSAGCVKWFWISSILKKKSQNHTNWLIYRVQGSQRYWTAWLGIQYWYALFGWHQIVSKLFIYLERFDFYEEFVMFETAYWRKWCDPGYDLWRSTIGYFPQDKINCTSSW